MWSIWPNMPEEGPPRLLQYAMGKVGEYQGTREGLIKRFRDARVRRTLRDKLVEIAAYGLVDPELSPFEKQHALASRSLKATDYCVRQDMSEVIRVEQPQEMIPWRDVPKDLETWKKFGNEFFTGLNMVNKGQGALTCYKSDATSEN
ncbi:hypothetical protein PHMEG_0003573 [Phytophthora megakarya]|uniref:Uncharacterized protein n=1 Tax=Phytophthora megakarya TaxID=4795 RepID=A0A225WW05_9STRA|nr:hypothetical protein PHMEG_0003573 [Phytophthora megakarya]